MSEDKRVKPIRVHIEPSVDRCIICGEIVPEGYEVCPYCWDEYFSK